MEGSAGRDIMIWKRVLSPEYIDKSFAIIGLIIAVSLLVVNFIQLKSLLITIVFVMVSISCLIYLKIGDKFDAELKIPKFCLNVKLFDALFFLLYTLSALILYFRPNHYERPLAYFVVIILMSGVLAGGCISADRRHIGFILIQIFLLGMNLGWSHLMIVPSLIGVDPWYHCDLTSRIIDGFYIPEGYAYADLPIFHLMIAITSIISDYSYKFAAMLSVSFGQIICNAMFTFLFANYLFKNHRVGLLAALLTMIGDIHICWTYWSIPNAFGGIFILPVIYLLFTKYNHNSFSRLVTAMLVILLMSTIILTHALIAGVTAILLFVAYASFRYRELILGHLEAIKSLLIPCFFSLAMFGWWMYGSNVINNFAYFMKEFSLDFLTISRGLSSTIFIPQFELIFPSLGRYLFFSLAIIGILYMISLKGNNTSFTLAILSLTLLVFPFVFYVSGRTVFEERFAYLSLIFLSIPLALALYLLGTYKTKAKIITYCFTIGAVIMLSFLSIMSITACVDNHTFAPIIGRTAYYTQSELSGSEFFGENAVGVISSDFYYSYNPSSSIFEHIYGFDRKRLHNLELSINSGEFYHDGSVKIIRSSLIQEFERQGFISQNILPNVDIFLSNSGFNKIYDNSAMLGYIG